MVGQLMQDAGIKAISTLSWAEPETFSFCFDGIEPGCTVAVSTVGVMRDKEAMTVWKAGMDAAIERIKPKNIVCYGSAIDYDFGHAFQSTGPVRDPTKIFKPLYNGLPISIHGSREGPDSHHVQKYR